MRYISLFTSLEERVYCTVYTITVQCTLTLYSVHSFSDPEQVAPNGTDPASVYPHTLSLPPSGIQRGSVKISGGDPLSPDWASVPGAYRLDVDEADLPKIPCQPIGNVGTRQHAS